MNFRQRLRAAYSHIERTVYGAVDVAQNLVRFRGLAWGLGPIMAIIPGLLSGLWGLVSGNSAPPYIRDDKFHGRYWHRPSRWFQFWRKPSSTDLLSLECAETAPSERHSPRGSRETPSPDGSARKRDESMSAERRERSPSPDRKPPVSPQRRLSQMSSTSSDVDLSMLEPPRRDRSTDSSQAQRVLTGTREHSGSPRQSTSRSLSYSRAKTPTLFQLLTQLQHDINHETLTRERLKTYVASGLSLHTLSKRGVSELLFTALVKTPKHFPELYQKLHQDWLQKKGSPYPWNITHFLRETNSGHNSTRENQWSLFAYALHNASDEDSYQCVRAIMEKNLENKGKKAVEQQVFIAPSVSQILARDNKSQLNILSLVEQWSKTDSPSGDRIAQLYRVLLNDPNFAKALSKDSEDTLTNFFASPAVITTIFRLDLQGFMLANFRDKLALSPDVVTQVYSELPMAHRPEFLQLVRSETLLLVLMQEIAGSAQAAKNIAQSFCSSTPVDDDDDWDEPVVVATANNDDLLAYETTETSRHLLVRDLTRHIPSLLSELAAVMPEVAPTLSPDSHRRLAGFVLQYLASDETTYAHDNAALRILSYSLPHWLEADDAILKQPSDLAEPVDLTPSQLLERLVERLSKQNLLRMTTGAPMSSSLDEQLDLVLTLARHDIDILNHVAQKYHGATQQPDTRLMPSSPKTKKATTAFSAALESSVIRYKSAHVERAAEMVHASRSTSLEQPPFDNIWDIESAFTAASLLTASRSRRSSSAGLKATDPLLSKDELTESMALLDPEHRVKRGSSYQG